MNPLAWEITPRSRRAGLAHSHARPDYPSTMSIIRSISTVGAATLASRALALIRDIGVAAVLGAGAFSDAYFAALQIPNLFRRLLAEGGVNGAFVPIWLRLRGASTSDRANVFGASVFGSA